MIHVTNFWMTAWSPLCQEKVLNGLIMKQESYLMKTVEERILTDCPINSWAGLSSLKHTTKPLMPVFFCPRCRTPWTAPNLVKKLLMTRIFSQMLGRYLDNRNVKDCGKVTRMMITLTPARSCWARGCRSRQPRRERQRPDNPSQSQPCLWPALLLVNCRNLKK